MTHENGHNNNNNNKSGPGLETARKSRGVEIWSYLCLADKSSAEDVGLI